MTVLDYRVSDGAPQFPSVVCSAGTCCYSEVCFRNRYSCFLGQVRGDVRHLLLLGPRASPSGARPPATRSWTSTPLSQGAWAF